MSLEVVLIPIGIAAFTALREHRRTDLCEGCKTTRVKDPNLVRQALAEMNATNIEGDDQLIFADSSHGKLRFQMVDGIFLGRVNDATGDATSEMLSAFDRTVGAIAQRKSVEDLRARAAQLGLRVVGEEVADDGTIQLVFEEAK